MYFKLVLKICWWSQRAHYWFWGRPKGHIRGPKGHSALCKRPSENTACDRMVELYVKKRALYYAAKGLNPSAISRALGEEGQQYSRKSVSSLLCRVRDTGGFSRKPGSGKSTKIAQRVKDLIEEEM